MKTKLWTKSQIDAVNFLIKHKQQVRDAISNGKAYYTDPEEILAPIGLDDILVTPLSFQRVDEYLVLNAMEADGIVSHWLCQFTGTLMSNNRKLEVLVHIEEWIDWDFPKPKPPQHNSWKRGKK